MGRRFEGKTVFVTGAGSGIGRAACLAFAEEGARVAAADLNNSAYLTAKQILGKGGKAVGLQCDVCDSAAVDNAIKQCEAELGPIDVAFNCAGVEQPHASLADISDSVAEKVVGVNIMGLFHSMRSEIQAMMRRSAPGVILNVASGASVLGITGQAVYVASKFAVDGLTKSAALDHIKDGIRINSISPGIIWTEMIARLTEKNGQQGMIDQEPIGRLGTVGEITDAVLYMCSEQSSFMVGHNMVIDGGQTAGIWK